MILLLSWNRTSAVGINSIQINKNDFLIPLFLSVDEQTHCQAIISVLWNEFIDVLQLMI